MLKKKVLVLFLAVVMVFALLAGCGGGAPASSGTDSEQPAANEQPADKAAADGYKDGVYSAEMEDFNEESGYKDTVKIEVKDGKVVSVDWNAVHKDGGKDKKAASNDGEYPMVEVGGASAPWHEQAAKAEAYLIEKQDPAAIVIGEDGMHTDVISGATIEVDQFAKLAAKALESAK